MTRSSFKIDELHFGDSPKKCGKIENIFLCVSHSPILFLQIVARPRGLGAVPSSNRPTTHSTSVKIKGPAVALCIGCVRNPCNHFTWLVALFKLENGKNDIITVYTINLGNEIIHRIHMRSKTRHKFKLIFRAVV